MIASVDPYVEHVRASIEEAEAALRWFADLEARHAAFLAQREANTRRRLGEPAPRP